MRRIIGIVLIALIIVALGLLSYYYFVFDKIDPNTGEKVSFREFLPFGASENVPNENNPNDGENPDGYFPDTTSTSTEPDPAFKLPKFFHITEKPVAGSVQYDTASGTIVRYIERETGNVYDFETFTGKTFRITNTTIPQIREAIWSKDGKSVLVRYLKPDNETIDTFSASIKKGEGDGVGELEGVFLDPNINSLSIIGPNKIFYLITEDSRAYGYTSGLQGENKVLVFQNPIKEWLSMTVATDTVALATKPASYAPGYLYFFNPSVVSLSKVLGSSLGFISLPSPNKQYVLYTDNAQAGPVLKLRDLKTNIDLTIDINALPSKCVWLSDSSGALCNAPKQRMNMDFIDLWLQGVVKSEDNIWHISNIGIAEIAYEPSRTEKDIKFDGIKPNLNALGTRLVIVNRNDSSLWTLDLEN